MISAKEKSVFHNTIISNDGNSNSENYSAINPEEIQKTCSKTCTF